MKDMDEKRSVRQARTKTNLEKRKCKDEKMKKHIISYTNKKKLLAKLITKKRKKKPFFQQSLLGE